MGKAKRLQRQAQGGGQVKVVSKAQGGEDFYGRGDGSLVADPADLQEVVHVKDAPKQKRLTARQKKKLEKVRFCVCVWVVLRFLFGYGGEMAGSACACICGA